MAYRTILVCLNDIARNPVLLDLTSDIAERQDAHVIGLYVLPAVRIYPAIGPGMYAEVIEEFRDSFKARAAEVRRQFDGHMQAKGIAAEWRFVDSRFPEIAATVIEHARQADLVVVSQVDPDSDSGIDIDFAERIVMDSGRPVLVVPAFGTFKRCGPRALVGWNGRREAARAAFDAVPLLQACESVQVTWLDPQNDMDVSGDVPGSLAGAELATALARHGLKVTAEAMPTSGIGAGEALLSHASDLGADLLVMGAYGHSRTREYVFGGATRTILGSMTIPVLMSH
ncbi:MAG TPA: universal stress protein [Aestuariivirgaceae bacterium]|nr:universal stress protein [Aestuariivirgaceae bacterium]